MLAQSFRSCLCLHVLSKSSGRGLSGWNAAAQCPSKRRCRQCQAKHHTMLHKESAAQTKRHQLILFQQSALLRQRKPDHHSIDLPAENYMASSGSCVQSCRAQLDTGAMPSLITCKLANSFHVKKINGTAVTISGIWGRAAQCC